MDTLFEWTDEQTQEYLRKVDEYLRARDKNGVLVSSYDFVAAAMIPMMLAGRQLNIPSSWVFATVRPDVLPPGLEDKVHRLRDSLDALDKLDEELSSIIETARQTAKAVRNLSEKLTVLETASEVLKPKLRSLNMSKELPK